MSVCIIGSGASGLPAIKECHAHGLRVCAYERSSDIGGLWNYRPEMNIGATVMKSTTVNTSKEMMAYSDFPPPTEYSNFMHHSKVLEYLRNYATANDLYKHIKFNTTVKQLTNVDGSWEVTTDDGTKEKFDYAMICTGHHSDPYYPEFKGLDTFPGKVLHSHQYRDSTGFEGKNVFIVGIGNTALDIATELSSVAKTVTLSTRRGTWIFNRVNQGGMPYDTKLLTRFYDFLMSKLPWTILNDFMEHRVQQRLDHDLYGLRPNHRFFQQHPALNDCLPSLLCSGQVVITDDIDHVDGSSIHVKNGQTIEADVIILSTGYTFSFPFLHPQSVIPIKDQDVELYKYVFPVRHRSLAVIGLIQPIGSILPISEMQSRWAAAVFTGNSTLPCRAEMLEDIQLKRERIWKRYFKSPKHTIQVDYMKYMDEIAELIGCKPNLKKYLLSDPSFFLRLLIGPNAPYAYRLEGPDAWTGAQHALTTLPERVKGPLKNRQCRTRRYKKRGKIDEHFRYMSMKWLAGWTCMLLITGLWVFCSGPRGLTAFVYSAYVLIFLFLFSFILLWFDLQYDMTTIF